MNHHTHPTQAPAKGFSLVELVTVIAVLSVVMSLGTTMFFKIMDAGSNSARLLRMEEKANNSFATMREDFGQMLATADAGTTLYGEDRNTQDNVLAWGIKLDDDRVTLPIAATNIDTETLKQWSVRYQIRRDEQGPPRLERLLAPLVQEDTETTPQVVAEWVTGMNIEYHDGISWRPSWDKKQAPESVRISLTLMSPNRPNEQIARKSAFTLHVK